MLHVSGYSKNSSKLHIKVTAEVTVERGEVWGIGQGPLYVLSLRYELSQ